MLRAELEKEREGEKERAMRRTHLVYYWMVAILYSGYNTHTLYTIKFYSMLPLYIQRRTLHILSPDEGKCKGRANKRNSSDTDQVKNDWQKFCNKIVMCNIHIMEANTFHQSA